MSKSHLSRRQFLNRSLAAAGVAGGFAIGGTRHRGGSSAPTTPSVSPWPGSTAEAANTSGIGSNEARC